MAISVVVAVEPVADKLIPKITDRMAKLKIGLIVRSNYMKLTH